jgi:hypothetical protein
MIDLFKNVAGVAGMAAGIPNEVGEGLVDEVVAPCAEGIMEATKDAGEAIAETAGEIVDGIMDLLD